MNITDLDLVFSALSDATRRGMLARLSSGESNVKSLARDYDMSQPAISKHLKVLEKAGLVTRSKKGRESIVRIDPRPIRGATDWIDHYAAFWWEQFDAVDTYLKAKKAEKED